MLIQQIVKITFSPTHCTDKIVDAIMQGWGIANQRAISLNSLSQRHNFALHLQGNEAVILGIPVYEERIPDLLYPALANIRGQGQPMALIVTYGNISAGIALKQLNKMMHYQGFNILAAAAFIGEHSFSQETVKIASGRPDKLDLKKAEAFGEEIKLKIKSIQQNEKLPELNIKGELLTMSKILPKHSEMLFAHAPFVDFNRCQQCRRCLESCPVNAIDPESLKSREKLCIRCFACVKFCPHGARKMIYKKPVLVKTVLNKLGKKRHEPEIYI